MPFCSLILLSSASHCLSLPFFPSEPHSSCLTLLRSFFFLPLLPPSRQVVGPVQWEKTIKTLLDKGLAESYEVGPGKVISGIVKRIDKAAKIETYTV